MEVGYDTNNELVRYFWQDYNCGPRSPIPNEVDYPEFSIALSLVTAFYQQVPPKFHLFNPACKACRDKVEPSMRHEDYCYNKIPF